MLISVDKNNQKSLIVPPAGSLVGKVVGLEGINGPHQFDDVLSGKRLSAIQKSFVSNSSGLVQCQGITLSCKAGPIVASGPDLKNRSIKITSFICLFFSKLIIVRCNTSSNFPLNKL
jgi:hypothetical protein